MTDITRITGNKPVVAVDSSMELAGVCVTQATQRFVTEEHLGWSATRGRPEAVFAKMCAVSLVLTVLELETFGMFVLLSFETNVYLYLLSQSVFSLISRASVASRELVQASVDVALAAWTPCAGVRR